MASRQGPEHLAAVAAVTGHTTVGVPAKRTGQTELVSPLGQRHRTGVADDPIAVAGAFEPGAP